MIEKGRQAPRFTLPDQDGKPVSSTGLFGRWVVLYFYPRDDTPGCTVEACEFTALRGEFDELGAEVLGCSSDNASAHTKFIGKHRLGIRLLTDADRSVMKAYGAFGKKVMYGKQVEGVIRSTVLIAPDGKVAHHWAKVRAAGHAEQVRGVLAELQGGAPAGAARKAVRRAAAEPGRKAAVVAAKKPAGKAAKKAAKGGARKPAAKKRAGR
jgi:peroxiredoxin Q/BCP